MPKSSVLIGAFNESSAASANAVLALRCDRTLHPSSAMFGSSKVLAGIAGPAFGGRRRARRNLQAGHALTVFRFTDTNCETAQ